MYDLAICHHESGHAVAYHYFGVAFYDMSAIPEVDSLGHVRARAGSLIPEAQFICILSGPVAEHFYRGTTFSIQPSNNPISDYARSKDLIEKGYSFTTALWKAEAIVKSNWTQVVSAAHWLSRIGTLSHFDFKLAIKP